MNKYTICVVDRRYHYIDVIAEDETDAKDKVWCQIGRICNKEADDIDTDVIVEEVAEVKQSDRLPADWII